MTDNIRNIHQNYYIEEDSILKEMDLLKLSEYLINNIKIQESDTNLIEIVDEFDREMDLSVGTGLSIFKYLLAHKKILTNMNKKLMLNKIKASELKFVENEFYGSTVNYYE